MPLGVVSSGSDSVPVEYEIKTRNDESGRPTVVGYVKFLETIPYNIDVVLIDVGSANLVLEGGKTLHIEFEEFRPLELWASFIS